MLQDVIKASLNTRISIQAGALDKLVWKNDTIVQSLFSNYRKDYTIYDDFNQGRCQRYLFCPTWKRSHRVGSQRNARIAPHSRAIYKGSALKRHTNVRLLAYYN